MCGFVFAFKLFRPADRAKYTWQERIINTFMHDNVLHVTMFPVLDVPDPTKPELCVTSNALTAVMEEGYYEHPVSVCGDSTFVFHYVPMSPETTYRGLQFLHSLHDLPYSYSCVPLLPYWLKMRAQCADAPLDFAPQHIICSQMGLLLCHLCHVFTTSEVMEHAHALHPPSCTPGELYALVQRLGSERDLADLRVQHGKSTHQVVADVETDQAHQAEVRCGMPYAWQPSLIFA